MTVKAHYIKEVRFAKPVVLAAGDTLCQNEGGYWIKRKNGEIETVPVRETVTKDIVLEVAPHVNEHGLAPACTDSRGHALVPVQDDIGRKDAGWCVRCEGVWSGEQIRSVVEPNKWRNVKMQRFLRDGEWNRE